MEYILSLSLLESKANKALLPEGDAAAVAEPDGGDGGADAKAEREAAQYRLMVTQVAFWVVVIGLFFGRFVVCPRRPRRKGEKRSDLLRSY